MSDSKALENFTPPAPEWLSAGTWYITHSTLPLWSGKRNVTVTYKHLPSASNGAIRLDDLVTYQTLTSNKVKTVHGIDTASGATNTGEWNWKGKGLLSLASSHWAILSYGGVEGGEQWVVTYFMKTLFTPAGIDIYSRSRDGLSAETVKHIKEALSEVQDRHVRELAVVIFEIPQDWSDQGEP